MSNKLYITATEARSGKSAICLGMMEVLLRKVRRVAFFRPIIQTDPQNGDLDNDIRLLSERYNLDLPYQDMYAYTHTTANDLIKHGRSDEVIEGVISKCNRLAETYDFVLCEGTDYEGSTSSFEFDINAEIIRNLGSPVLLVANAFGKPLDDTLRAVELALESLWDKDCEVLSIIVNRVEPENHGRLVDMLKAREQEPKRLVYAIPNVVELFNPTVSEIVGALDAKVLYGEDQLNRHVHNFTVAAMQLRNFLPRISHGTLIITPGDRADIIVACLATLASLSMDNIAGLVLTGGLLPEEPIQDIIKGFTRTFPILSVDTDTFPTARAMDAVKSQITPDNDRKITRALAIFEKNVDVTRLAETIITTQPTTVTPKMFEYELIQRARSQKRHIVLPEGEEERILRAVEILLRREVADITLLGREDEIRRMITRLSLRMNHVQVIDPTRSKWFEEYAYSYYQLRKHKGLTPENARDIISDVSYFGTMMVHRGQADGMVSGAVHTTATTVRPAFEIIKTQSGVSIVSSVFFMCLENRVLVYGDCAVNPNPTAEQLAQIAISSAQTAQLFGITPRVAMLSYSTGESGMGEDVERVREATRLAQVLIDEKHLEIKLDGPIQYDAAVDAAVARTKLPDSEVAGQATVFIFPDLNTGNNTYKAVQRSSGAVAVGPVLQGLNKPVNDLSRGCTVPDIVNTVAITAIQAQSR